MGESPDRFITDDLLPHFKPAFSREDAFEYLKDKPTRSFIIRRSSNCAFVITYVKKPGTIMHHRIMWNTATGFSAEGKPDEIFPTLIDLLRHKTFLDVTSGNGGTVRANLSPSGAAPYSSVPTRRSGDANPYGSMPSSAAAAAVATAHSSPTSVRRLHQKKHNLDHVRELAKYYHPKMSRTDAEALLRRQPDKSLFVVRHSSSPGAPYALSFIDEKKDSGFHHCVVQFREGAGYYLEGDRETFPDLLTLLRVYNFIPGGSGSGTGGAGSRPNVRPSNHYRSAYDVAPGSASSSPYESVGDRSSSSFTNYQSLDALQSANDAARSHTSSDSNYGPVATVNSRKPTASGSGGPIPSLDHSVLGYTSGSPAAASSPGQYRRPGSGLNNGRSSDVKGQYGAVSTAGQKLSGYGSVPGDGQNDNYGSVADAAGSSKKTPGYSSTAALRHGRGQDSEGTIYGFMPTNLNEAEQMGQVCSQCSEAPVKASLQTPDKKLLLLCARCLAALHASQRMN